MIFFEHLQQNVSYYISIDAEEVWEDLEENRRKSKKTEKDICKNNKYSPPFLIICLPLDLLPRLPGVD